MSNEFLPFDLQEVVFAEARRDIAERLTTSGVAAKAADALRFVPDSNAVAVVSREPYYDKTEEDMDPLSSVVGYEYLVGFETTTPGGRKWNMIPVVHLFGGGEPIPANAEIFNTSDVDLVSNCIADLVKLRREVPILQKDLKRLY